MKKIQHYTFAGILLSFACASEGFAQTTAPVPGYVPPVTLTQTPNYADDTRGVFIPSHTQHRLKTYAELDNSFGEAKFQHVSADYTGPDNLVADAFSNDQVMENELNRISGGYASGSSLSETHMASLADQPQIYAQAAPQQVMMSPEAQPQHMLSTDHQMLAEPRMVAQTPPARQGNGVEVARGEIQRKVIDMQNGVVRLKEDRISVRRALQRMMDQIGGGEWTIIWDMAEQNAALPDMEISVYAEEPFINVLNALLARIQTRSGQPLRVIRYDNTQRLVITDRPGGHRLAGSTSAVGVGDVDEVAVTETVLKEAMVSLHYDEVPLVDALENIVNQAGRGEWRLRVYAGLDQVLKPAHIEEPFNVAMERVLKLFNLKYEIFPGGKLIVVTHNNRFGYNGVK